MKNCTESTEQITKKRDGKKMINTDDRIELDVQLPRKIVEKIISYQNEINHGRDLNNKVSLDEVVEMLLGDEIN